MIVFQKIKVILVFLKVTAILADGQLRLTGGFISDPRCRVSDLSGNQEAKKGGSL